MSNVASVRKRSPAGRFLDSTRGIDTVVAFFGRELAKYLRDEGAKDVRSAVLTHKLHDRKAYPGMRADFTGLDVADRFLFGCGMDYKGYWATRRESTR